MSDIAYSELTERYWIMVNGQKDREVTQYMAEHDVKVRAEVIDEVEEAIEEHLFDSPLMNPFMTRNEILLLLEQLKEKKE